MRSSLLQRGWRVVLAGGAAASLLFTVAAPAGAVPPPTLLDKNGNGVFDAGDEYVVVAGSDTLEFVTESIVQTFPSYIKSHLISVKPGPALTAPVTIPGDLYCGTFQFDSTEPNGSPNDLLTDSQPNGKMYPPFGSTDGRNALRQSADPALTYGSASIDTGGGCIDVARSSSAPSGSDPTEFEYYGFALDSLSWGTTSLKAPVSLTLQQVRDIYNCADEATAGLTPAQQAIDADTGVNNWAEVGGAFGPIHRALAQSGSGTRSFSISGVLGGVTPPDNATTLARGCPNTLQVRENDGRPFTSAANLPNYDNYIILYSTGKWVFQVTNKINPTLDIRNGVRLGAIARDPGQVCPTKGALTFPSANNAPTFAVRFDGAAYGLNSASLICSRSLAGVGAASAGSATLTAAAGTFTADMVGLQVEGSVINPGTTIVAVNGTGSEATISPGTTFFPPAGVTYPFTGSISVGIPVVSEFNPNISNGSNVSIFPGVRMLYHVLDTRQGAASYLEARTLFGFEPGTSTKSDLCDGANVGEILSNGFLDLPSVANNGTPSTTCRFF